jgi:hypothetical protein
VVPTKLLHLSGFIADNRKVNLVRRTLTAALVLCALGASAPAPAGAAIHDASTLAPDLAKLAQPSVRKLPARAQAKRLGLPVGGPGSLVREGGRVVVNVRFEAGALKRLGDLRQAGAAVVAASGRYQLVSAAVAPADLPSLSRLPGVASVTPGLAPVVHAVGGCEGGSVISEGVEQLDVPAAREAFGLRGAGVTVGILSDSYDTATEEAFGPGEIATHAAADVESNDLPGPAGTCSGQQLAVDVLEDRFSPAGEVHDEGRAMAQIVHDVAPHARLAFATAYGTELSFAENIEWLARPVAKGGAGANVIVDDVGYFEEPFFQDGPVANAIATVVGRGVTYLTAAGNENLFQSGQEQVEGEPGIASWEAPEFRHASVCPAALALLLEGESKTPDCMDFAPGAGSDSAFHFTVAPKSEVTIDLQWSEPWEGVEADLNAYLLTEGGVEEGLLYDNTQTQQPVELLQWENTSSSAQVVRLAIDRCASGCNPAANPAAVPRLKFILMGNVSNSEYPQSSEGDVVGPTIYGHAASTNAITLGAVRTPALKNGGKPEGFSSRGPATHYYGPVSGSAPAGELAIPETIEKPDVVATDCGATTFFAQLVGATWRFCGTSAAAPHAAAVAALMMQGTEPTADAASVAEALEDSAAEVGGGAFGADTIGAGLLDAKGALEAVGAAPTEADGPSVTVPPVGPEIEYRPDSSEQNPSPPTSPPLEPTPVAPRTSIRRHPPAVVRTRRAKARVAFAFAADQAGVTFLCKFDRGSFSPCGARFARFFALGAHVVRVKARGASGLVDKTPAVFHFRVVRIR